MSNKIAVITGASRGIGRAITLKYAQMGYDVAICCHHNKERLEETAKEVRSMQVRCLTYVGNIGNYNDACTFFHEIETKLGSIDILINNAGISCFWAAAGYNTGAMGCNDHIKLELCLLLQQACHP